MSGPHRTSRGPIVIGALLCLCIAASVFTEWALLSRRLDRLEKQARRLEDENAQHEQRQRRGALENMIKSTAKVLQDQFEAHRLDQDRVFKSFEERMAAAEDKMDSFQVSLRELQSTPKPAPTPSIAVETVAKQQVQLESLSKSLQSATRAWHAKLEELQGSVTQHSQKILGIETLSTVAKNQEQELKKLRADIKTEHEALSSLLVQHQTQVATVAQKQQALEIRIDAAAATQATTGAGAHATASGDTSTAANSGLPTDKGQQAALNTAGTRVQARQGGGGVGDVDTNEDDADAAASVAVLPDEEEGPQDAARASPSSIPATSAIKGLPSATSSVAGVPGDMPATAGLSSQPADSTTPSATSSVVSAGSSESPLATAGKASDSNTHSATSSVVSGRKAGTQVSSAAGASPAANAAAGDAEKEMDDVPAATSSVVEAATSKQAASSQQGGSGAALATAAQLAKPVRSSPSINKVVVQGSVLGLGMRAGHQAGGHTVGVGTDDTDREAQDELEALTGGGEDATANVMTDNTLEEDKLLAAGNGPEAASSVVGAPDAAAAQGGARGAAGDSASSVVGASDASNKVATQGSTGRASGDSVSSVVGASDSNNALMAQGSAGLQATLGRASLVAATDAMQGGSVRQAMTRRPANKLASGQVTRAASGQGLVTETAGRLRGKGRGGSAQGTGM